MRCSHHFRPPFTSQLSLTGRQKQKAPRQNERAHPSVRRWAGKQTHWFDCLGMRLSRSNLATPSPSKLYTLPALDYTGSLQATLPLAGRRREPCRMNENIFLDNEVRSNTEHASCVSPTTSDKRQPHRPMAPAFRSRFPARRVDVSTSRLRMHPPHGHADFFRATARPRPQPAWPLAPRGPRCCRWGWGCWWRGSGWGDCRPAPLRAARLPGKTPRVRRARRAHRPSPLVLTTQRFHSAPGSPRATGLQRISRRVSTSSSSPNQPSDARGAQSAPPSCALRDLVPRSPDLPSGAECRAGIACTRVATR